MFLERLLRYQRYGRLQLLRSSGELEIACNTVTLHIHWTKQGNRHASSSSKRWQNRQGRDKFAREARVQGLKSRAAFKLLEVRGLEDCDILYSH